MGEPASRIIGKHDGQVTGGHICQVPGEDVG